MSLEAAQYVTPIDPKAVFIDGQLLPELMIVFNVGVTQTYTYVVRRIDSDYFSEE